MKHRNSDPPKMHARSFKEEGVLVVYSDLDWEFLVPCIAHGKELEFGLSDICIKRSIIQS